MKNNMKRISLSACILGSSFIIVGCEKEEPAPLVQQLTEEKEVSKDIINFDTLSFKDLQELKSTMKSQSKEFGRFLDKHMIENIVAPDGSITVNKNMSYEKYTKQYNQLAYYKITPNYEDGTGYINVGMKLNVHMEDILSTDSSMVKAMFEIIKQYNPDITEKKFNSQLKEVSGSKASLADKELNFDIKGLSLNVYSRADRNERELVLSIRQAFNFPVVEGLEKEYDTVKEFKEDSQVLQEELISNIQKANENLNKLYVGKYDLIDLKVSDLDFNTSSQFSQSISLNYNARKGDLLSEELISALYEALESIVTKPILSKTINASDFEEYVKSLEIYNGLHTTGSLIDERGMVIEPNKLPFVSEQISLQCGFSLVNNTNDESIIEQDDNASEIKKYDSSILFKINIPVKAEGVKSL